MTGLSDTIVGTPSARVTSDDRAHHGHRADGIDVVHAAGLEQLAQRVGHEAVAAVAAVVRADAHVAVAAQLLLEDDPLPGAAADDAGDPHAARRETLGDGMHDRRADAAADADGMAGVDELRGAAQRSGDVGDGVTDPQRARGRSWSCPRPG